MRADPNGGLRQTFLSSVFLCLCLFLTLAQKNHTHTLSVSRWQPAASDPKGLTLRTQFISGFLFLLSSFFISHFVFFFLVFFPSACVCTQSLWDCSKFSSFSTLRHDSLLLVSCSGNHLNTDSACGKQMLIEEQKTLRHFLKFANNQFLVFLVMSLLIWISPDVFLLIVWLFSKLWMNPQAHSQSMSTFNRHN